MTSKNKIVKEKYLVRIHETLSKYWWIKNKKSMRKVKTSKELKTTNSKIKTHKWMLKPQDQHNLRNAKDDLKFTLGEHS